MMSNGVSMVVTKSTSIAVFDAGPIIHLDELDCLDLLSDFQKVILRSIRRGQRNPSQVINILHHLPVKSTLFIKTTLLEHIIVKVKDEFNL